jgi:hypothetical protein
VNLDHLERHELDGAWRRLCGAMIGQAALSLGSREFAPCRSKNGAFYRGLMAEYRTVARAWIEGGDALIPFEEACEAIDLNPEYALRGIEKYLSAPDRRLYRRSHSQPRQP